MNVTPISELELVITPDSDVEIFYMSKFLEGWKRGEARLVIEAEVNNNMVLTPLIQVPRFITKP